MYGGDSNYEKSHIDSAAVGDVGEWQDGAGGEDIGGSLGVVRGNAGYIRLRKLSLVCLFTCQKNGHSNTGIAADLITILF